LPETIVKEDDTVFTQKKRAALLAGVAAAALVMSGCSSAAEATDTATVGASDDTLILDIAGPLTDPFFGASKAGSDAAAEELGINYEYIASKDFTDIVAVYTKIMEAAIGRNPDAIVVGNYFPDALSPLIKKATEQGIVVVVTNSGRDTWRDLGAIGFVGEDPVAMGAEAGAQAVAAGATRGLCVNTVQGNPTLEARCRGYQEALEAAGGSATTLQIASEDGQNDSKIQQAVAGALLADPEIDDIFTLGAGPGLAALAAVEQVDKVGIVKVGTCDLSTAALESIKEGGLSYLIDQQPFLQGYYGLLVAHQFLKYGLKPASEIDTGPLVINVDNVDEVLEVGLNYPGIRGAS